MHLSSFGNPETGVPWNSTKNLAAPKARARRSVILSMPKDQSRAAIQSISTSELPGTPP
jgi:hypothetical protein